MRQKRFFIERREKWLPLPETNIAPANWWLEDEIFFQDSLKVTLFYAQSDPLSAMGDLSPSDSKFMP